MLQLIESKSTKNRIKKIYNSDNYVFYVTLYNSNGLYKIKVDNKNNKECSCPIEYLYGEKKFIVALPNIWISDEKTKEKILNEINDAFSFVSEINQHIDELLEYDIIKDSDYEYIE